MLPVYEAIAYSNEVLLGGTSRPLIFTVLNSEKNLEEYAVKIFKKKDYKQYNPLSKECFAYALAKEFSLPQPEAAIIEFKDDLLEVLPEDIRSRIKESGSRFHYATKFKNNFILFNSNFNLHDIRSYEIQTLFAFDVLIHNTDRVKQKPNLLVNGREFLLIDHDHSLLIPEIFLHSVKESDFSFLYNNDRLQSHIFLPYLKKLHKSEVVLFDEFEYFFQILNVNKLSLVRDLLEKIDIESSDFDVINEYISELKEKRNSFIKSLRYFL